ncbi:MAG: hypothetical protein IT459_01300 [Planctomycetes bacterium]|nr:hypothetical protein [Planctomycetota bacterium]
MNVAFACVVALVTQSTPKPLSSTELPKFVAGLDAAMRAPNEKQALAAFARVEALAERLDPMDFEVLLRDAVPGRPKKWKPGFTHGLEFTSGDTKFRYSIHLPKKAPQGLLPLVVDPGHISFAKKTDAECEAVMTTWLGLTGATDDVIYVRTRVFDQLEVAGDYATYCEPQRPKGKPDHDWMATALLDCIADASRRFPVDPDRVVIHGISMSAYWAWYAAAFAPDRFAAVVPVGSRTWHVRKLLPSYLATNVFVLHGEKDEVCAFDEARETVAELKQLGAPATLVNVQDGEHVKNTFPRWASLWTDVAACVRKCDPKTIARVGHSAERSGAFWLDVERLQQRAYSVGAPPIELKATRDGNSISIEAKGVESLRVLLSPRFVDLARPVTITVNGAKVHDGKVPFDSKAAFRAVWRRGDGGAAYAASVVVAVPKR